MTPSQIRQDLNQFGGFGHRAKGYSVSMLKGEILKILGADRGFTAILVGVGSIGHSFLEHFCFSEYGVQLKAAFDISQELIGAEICGVVVHPVNGLPEYLEKEEIDLAVLSVSEEAAVQVTDLLIENGIEAIWNFTNVDIVAPGCPVLVENVHFSDSLLALSYRIASKQDE